MNEKEILEKAQEIWKIKISLGLSCFELEQGTSFLEGFRAACKLLTDQSDLINSAEQLRDYLVEHDYAGDDGDIPDNIWLPFCSSLKRKNHDKKTSNNSSQKNEEV